MARLNPSISFTAACADPQLLGNVLGEPSWAPHRAMLCAAFGEPLGRAERALYDTLSGNRPLPTEPVDMLAVIAGRRSGKSRSIAAACVWLSALCRWDDRVVSGEIPTLLCIAPSQAQAALVHSYIAGIFEESDLLSRMVTHKTQDTIRLNNGVAIQVRPASFRKLRGMTLIAAVVDEIAYLFSESDNSRNPDSEIIAAAAPALASTGGPMIALSSPYRKTGVLYELYRDHFGNDNDPGTLVFQGKSLGLNPTLSPRIVERALAKDPELARSEYLAEFRTDLSNYVSGAAVNACVETGRTVRHYVPGERYFAFVDVSSGMGQDAFTMSIAHRDRETDGVVIDLVVGRAPPHNPLSVTAEFASICHDYGVTEVVGDKYSIGYAAKPWEAAGIRYSATAAPKSQIYADFLPLISAQRVALLDHDPSLRELLNLERRTGRGRDTIDHPRGLHDDYINSVAGAAVLANQNIIDPMMRLAGW